MEVMVNLLEWDNAKPMEVVTHMDFGSRLDNTDPVDTLEMMINQLLVLAQEALLRQPPAGECVQ